MAPIQCGSAAAAEQMVIHFHHLKSEPQLSIQRPKAPGVSLVRICGAQPPLAGSVSRVGAEGPGTTSGQQLRMYSAPLGRTLFSLYGHRVYNTGRDDCDFLVWPVGSEAATGHI